MYNEKAWGRLNNASSIKNQICIQQFISAALQSAVHTLSLLKLHFDFWLIIRIYFELGRQFSTLEAALVFTVFYFFMHASTHLVKYSLVTIGHRNVDEMLICHWPWNFLNCRLNCNDRQNVHSFNTSLQD